VWRRQNYPRKQDQFLFKKTLCLIHDGSQEKEERCSRGSDDFFGVGAA
jgi:hypothetical protein